MFAPQTSYTPYTFKLQGTIDSQADSALSGLEDLLQVKGYDWLEDYMANVERVAKAGRAGASGNLAQVLKTPSRTPRTVPKTRTGLAKEKQREDKVRLANANAQSDLDLMGRGEEDTARKARPIGKTLLFAPLATASPASSPSPTRIKQTGASSSKPASTLSKASIPKATLSSSNPFLVEEDEIIVHAIKSGQVDPDVEKDEEEERPQEPVLRSSAAVSKAVHENPEGDEEHKKNGVREAEVKEEMEMENIAQGLGEVTLRSPAKVDQEPARQTSMQVDIPVHSQTVSAHVSTTIQMPSAVENASTVLPVSDASGDVEEKKRQTEFMIPLRDSITPVKSTTATTARKSTYRTERQTPISFSPSSVAFAALPSRGPSRGKSVGGQKRMTLKASEAPEQVHQPYPQEDVKEDLEDKSRMPAVGIVKSVRLAPASSARQVDPGPVSAPAATPAQVSRHTSGQDRGQQAGPASQGNNNKKSGPGVRSSWLRQAMANAGGEQGVRKSMAGNALRKKSEFDKDVEEEEEENKEEEEEEEEEEEVVHQAVLLEDEPALKGKTHATSDIAQVSGEVASTVLDQAHAAESKTSTKSTRDIKLVERQPLEPINLSRQLNQSALDLPLAVETMPQSKLAKMIADLEEKKAAASLAASASRMTLGGQSLSGQHGILGGGTGWNPLRNTLGGLRLRDEAGGTPKDENGPISLLPRQDVIQSDINEDVEADEADEQEGFSKRKATAVVVEAVVESDVQTEKIEVDLKKTASETNEVTIEVHRQTVVEAVEDGVVESQQRSSYVVSTTPTEPIYPDIGQLPGAAVQLDNEKPSNQNDVLTQRLSGMIPDSIDSAPTVPSDHQAFSTPVKKDKQDTRIIESTTPMVSPPRAFRPGAFALHQVRGPSQLQNVAGPPAARPPKLSMLRVDSAEEIRVADEILSKEAPTPFADILPKAKFSSTRAQTPPLPTSSEVTSVKPAVPARAPPTDPAATTILPAPAGLSVSTAQVIPDDTDDDHDELESSEEEEDHEEAEESKEDIEEAVALLTKDMRFGEDEAENDSEAPSDAETVTEKAGAGGKGSGASSLASSKLGSSTTSKMTAQKNLTLASSIARKIDGQRPVIGQIDSLMKAQQAREKEAAMTANRAAKQEARDQRKRDEMRERAAREKAEQEAERKEKLIRQERLKKLRDEQDRKRKEAYERGIAEKEKAALAASQKKAKLASAPKEVKRPAQIHAKPREPAGKPMVPELNKSTAPTRPHPIMKTIIPTGPLVPTASTMPMSTNASSSTAGPSRPLGAPSKPSLANAGPVRPAKASMQAGLQRPILNSNNQQNHPGMRNSTIVPVGGDRKTVTPAQAGGVFAVGQSAVVTIGKTGIVSGEQDTRAEDIELPDIDSDYGMESESDDDAASWTASPAIRRAIDMQSAVDPAHLFGPLPEFKMEDVFLGARSAKRPRSSSANWSGADRLTEQEKLEYAKRMNYRDDSALVW